MESNSALRKYLRSTSQDPAYKHAPEELATGGLGKADMKRTPSCLSLDINKDILSGLSFRVLDVPAI